MRDLRPLPPGQQRKPLVARDDLPQRARPGDGKPGTPGPALLVLRHPGQARAQQLAGLALGDLERARAAERALAGCVLDRQVTALLTDASLCHGWAGVVQALWRAAGDALSPQPLEAALREARRGMEDHPARAGPPTSGGLLEGTSGIQFAQNDLPRTGGEPPCWDACLLLAL